MAEFTYKFRETIYNYGTDDLTEIPLSGQKRYYTSVITGQVSPVYVLGDGTSRVNQLPFIDIVNISTASNVDLESLRITGNRVRIFNSHTAAITVQTGVTGSLTYENINTKCTSTAFFDGTYWRVEDGAQIGDIKPWHKNFNGGALSLPWGWRAMDGTTISDSESPFNGATFEDLNGDARFLRGAATSGTEQADAMQRITGDLFFQQTNGEGTGAFSNGSIESSLRPANGTNGCRRVSFDSANSTSPNAAKTSDTETRPINMSVVWIIKIK